MLTSPSFRETLRHVALRVCGIKSEIVQCFASHPAKAPRGEILLLYATNQEWPNPLRFPLD